MTLTKRKPSKRRKQHKLAYYMAELTPDKTLRQVLDLLSDAAHQPKRVLDDKDYEKIYWKAHDLLGPLMRKEN